MAGVIMISLRTVGGRLYCYRLRSRAV